ncbi:muscle M-line assembly protein unc-89-like isoform X8 [Mytilus edulis]|uniref:muscle M-line assembly protein unc-89-like isoform X8 n=3 Tax=Mytilus edulis TaxID=6550 RepID=UPI0039EF4A0E
MSAEEVEETMSQFDALLDFNDTSSGDGTVKKSSDFDPFGPSSTLETKGSSDGDLLGDFGFTGQASVTTNGNGQSVNPLYELSMDQGFSTSESNNLIMSEEIDVSQKSTKSSNPLYDFENNDSTEPSANPLYDLSAGETNGHDVDLLGTGISVVTDDSGVTMETEASNEGDNLLLNTGDSLKFEVRRDESHESMNGISDEDSELVEKFNEAEHREILQKQTESLAQGSDVIREQTEITFDDQPGILITQEEDQLIETREDPVEVGDHLVETSQDLVEVGDQLAETSQDLVEVGDQLVESSQDLVEVGDLNEPEVVGDVQNDQDITEETEEIIEITQQEVAADTETEPEVQQYSEEFVETAEEEEDLNQNNQPDPVEVVPDTYEIVSDTVEVVTQEEELQEQEVELQEQKVIPTEEFENRTSSSSLEEQKETTSTTKTTTVTEKTQGTGGSVTSSQSGVVENGFDEGVFRESDKNEEEVSFDQMSSIRNKLESNQSDEVVRERKKSVHEEIASAEGGEYENEPVRNPDVVRESDKDIGAELPEVGSAQNILQKFKQIETTTKSYKRESTPPEARVAGKVEYVSEPKKGIENEPQKVEGGVFENVPTSEEGVVHSYDAQEEALPEKGYAKNIMERFKQIGTQSGESNQGRRELTPDRNTKYEYVSEPRSVMEKYEGKMESGIFESQPTEDLPDIIRSGMHSEESLPEKGTAKNLASRFKEISDKAGTAHVSERKRELTPDKTGKVEYVSEPRSVLPKYEGKSESGIFESSPEGKEEIVKSDMQVEEVLPEKGAARNIAAKFREIESSKSPSPSSTPKPKYKEVTPPRDDVDGRTVAGVLESTPTQRGDIVKGSDGMEFKEEELPERGMAKNLASKFKQYGQTQTSPASRGKKEFTPPPDKGGVFENTPTPSLQVEVRQAESGILESTPKLRDDVSREGEASAGDVEFPEEGYAKNMVSKWKQLETSSGKNTPSPKHKEFTPPRDFPMSPKSPAGVNSSVQPGDLPGQYQEQGRPSVFESHPQHLYGVAREGESDTPESMPEKDAAKSMVEKFKAIQEQAKKAGETPKPVSRKDSTDSGSSPVETSTKPKKGSFVPVQLEKCAACQKTVYAVEKLEMNKHIYHRACFKCSHCKCVLTAKTFSMNEGIIFCTNHFKQLFARKGNYDEGFGRQQYKKKWVAGESNEEQ